MEKKGNQVEYPYYPALDDLLYAVDAFDCGYLGVLPESRWLTIL
jgi:hypothetical protein